jgi:predicted nucleic acid-binding protein
VDRLDHLMAHPGVVGITSVIYQEILQGAKTERLFQKFRVYFSDQRFYHPIDPIKTYTEAAWIYYRCRRKGITVRSTTDCLIARIAIEHDLILLHNDQDFSRMTQVIKELREA